MEETLLPSPMPLPQPRVGVTNRSSEDLSGDRPASAHGLPPSAQADVSTPAKSTAAGIGAGADSAAGQAGDTSETRPSRSASIASRSNRLSLTLPIAHPAAPPSRPLPMSSSASSFPVTPNDLAKAPLAPADIITAIAAEERRILDLREELARAEANLDELKMQWAFHEVQKKRAEERRRVEQKRALSVQTGAAVSAADPLATPLEDVGPKRSLEEDKRKALLLNQQPTADDPSTPTQSRRRVFRGGHARTLSLLSPTKVSSNEEPFSVLEDQFDETELVKSAGLSSHDPDSPFLQRYSQHTPRTAAKLSKRSSWAPQSVNQAGGLKQVAGQVAGELSATLWNIVDDIRQAAVGDEPISGSATAMRTVDTNSRSATNDDSQNTIRASASAPGRPHVSRAFPTESPTSPTPKSRPAASGHAKEKAVKSSSEATPSKRADSKAAKPFTWAPLSSDPFDDDSEWTNWDTATVKSRWSGSTANGDSTIAEQMDENTVPQKEETPMSPSIDISWPSALKGLTPSSLKRTATDLMRELEKSLAVPEDSASVAEASQLRG